MRTPRRLGREYSIREIASMWRKGYWATREVLFRMNEEAHGTLLVNRGGEGKGARWRVSLPSLRKLRPDWFEDTANLTEELDELRDELRDVKTRQIISAAHVGQLKNKLRAA